MRLERECCLLVLNSVTSRPRWIRVGDGSDSKRPGEGDGEGEGQGAGGQGFLNMISRLSHSGVGWRKIP